MFVWRVLWKCEFIYNDTTYQSVTKKTSLSITTRQPIMRIWGNRRQSLPHSMSGTPLLTSPPPWKRPQAGHKRLNKEVLVQCLCLVRLSAASPFLLLDMDAHSSRIKNDVPLQAVTGDDVRIPSCMCWYCRGYYLDAKLFYHLRNSSLLRQKEKCRCMSPSAGMRAPKEFQIHCL